MFGNSHSSTLNHWTFVEEEDESQSTVPLAKDLLFEGFTVRV